MTNSIQNILNYRVIGNGHPVIFLHGFLESLEMWSSLRFSKNFQKIVVDLPGHGASYNASTEETMQSMAQAVKVLVDSLNIDSYSLVGHSMGGYVGMELKKFDERCREVVLLNSNFWSDSVLKLEQRKRVANIVERNKTLFLYEAIPNLFFDPVLHDAEVKMLILESKKMRAENISIISLAMGRRFDNTQVLSAHTDDFLIIQGEEDSTIKLDVMSDALNGFDVTYKVFKGVGHMAHIEDGIRTVEEIEKFIQKKTETN